MPARETIPADQSNQLRKEVQDAVQCLARVLTRWPHGAIDDARECRIELLLAGHFVERAIYAIDPVTRLPS